MSEAVKRRFFTWKLLFRLVLAGFILGVIAIIAFLIWMMALGRSVPSVDTLTEYDPPVTSRVHAGDGTLIYEFADQHRVFVPYEAIPEHVRQAFVSAEDKSFYTHGGVDYRGMTRGILNTIRNKITGNGGLEGGSTITQQVAKNMLLTRDQNITRKAKEMIVSWRMEKAFSKEHILATVLSICFPGADTRTRLAPAARCCRAASRSVKSPVHSNTMSTESSAHGNRAGSRSDNMRMRSGPTIKSCCSIETG